MHSSLETAYESQITLLLNIQIKMDGSYLTNLGLMLQQIVSTVFDLNRLYELFMRL